MLMRSLILAASFVCGAALACGASWADEAPLFAVPGAASVRPDLSVVFAPGLSPEQAAILVSDIVSHELCGVPQGFVAGDGKHATIAFTPSRDLSKAIWLLADGQVEYDGVDPSPDARRFYSKLADLEKCSG